MIDVEWQTVGEWDYPKTAPMKTLTELVDAELVNKINMLFEQPSKTPDSYNDQMFLEKVFVSPEKLQEMKELLDHKYNIILQGAPGVGKTFAAKRLAYALMGVVDDERIEFVQFHQNYSYEDFIMGYRPNGDGGFYMQEGVFYKFCNKAKEDPENTYFFVIDEINRGNLSKIFGELLMAIEADYRNENVRLAYKDDYFSVPKNVRIIGMMNTADRSLAMIDYALRRRFSFIPMEPGFDSDGFKNYQASLHNGMFNELIEAVKSLNTVIEKDESLGSGFCLGHSYFCNLNPDTCTKARLQEIVKYDLFPTLEEYWFDNKSELEIQKQALWDIVK